MKLKVIIIDDVPPEEGIDFLADVVHGTVLFNEIPGGPTEKLTPREAARKLNTQERVIAEASSVVQRSTTLIADQDRLISDLKESLAQLRRDKVTTAKPKKKPARKQ